MIAVNLTGPLNPTSARAGADPRVFRNPAGFSVTISWCQQSAPSLDWLHDPPGRGQLLRKATFRAATNARVATAAMAASEVLARVADIVSCDLLDFIEATGSRQRLFVEHYLGESSGSAVDAVRRAGYQWPEKLGPRLVEISRENGSSGSQQCPQNTWCS